MQKHTRIYLRHFNYTAGDNYIPSEISKGNSGAIHHIHRRGKGGNKAMDRIENLMALTDYEHETYGDKKCFKAMLYRIHKARLEALGKEFDRDWIDEQIKRYEPYETEVAV